MKVLFKRNEKETIEYDLKNLSIDFTTQQIDKHIQFVFDDFKINSEKYVQLRTKFRLISQKIDTLVLLFPKCFGNCWFCSNKEHICNKNYNFEKIIKEIEQSIDISKFKNFIFSGGEPFLHEDLFIYFLEKISKNSQIQIFTSLKFNNYNSFFRILSKLSKFNNIRFFFTLGTNENAHPSKNKWDKDIELIHFLKKKFNPSIFFKHSISSEFFVDEYYYLLEHFDEYYYTVLGILESYKNSFSKNEINYLRHFAKKNFNFIQKNGLYLKDKIKIVNDNISMNLIPILKGESLFVNNSYHIFIHSNSVEILDPVKNYPCFECKNFPLCKSSCETNKVYKRCFKCPILYSCCHTSALIPYYKKSTCGVAMRSELINYYLFFKQTNELFGGIL